MLAVPPLADRLGDIVLPAVLIAMAALFGIGAYLVYRSEAQITWPLPAVDSVAMLAVVPVGLVASSLVVADPRVGGGWQPVLAASIAVGCGLIVTLLFAALSTSMAEAPGDASALAFLPSSLVVAAVVLGAGRFSTHDAALGVSAALMIAALATLLDGTLNPRLRSLNTIVWFVLFVAVIALITRGGGATPVDGSSSAIALLITMAGGVMLIASPTLTARIDSQRRRRIRPEIS